MVEGLTSIKTNNRWFDFFYEDRGAAVTLVTFTAALPSTLETYPIFSGKQIASKLDVNRLAFFDAAGGSAESLPTFWHLRTKRVDSQRIILSTINKVLAQNAGRSLLFFGSSAGGFAALNYSSHFPGSAALVLNPRVNLLSEPRHFERYAAKAFVGADPTRLVRTLPYDMAKRYSLPRGNQVFYLQNLEDVNYVRHHYKHFVNAVDGRPDVTYVTADWGNGHVLPPLEAYMGPLRCLVSSAPNWALTPFV